MFMGRIIKSTVAGLLLTFVITFLYLTFDTIRLRRNMPGAGVIGYDPISIIRQGWTLFLAEFLVGFLLAWRRFK